MAGGKSSSDILHNPLTTTVMAVIVFIVVEVLLGREVRKH
jgi:hypothetical protein